MSIPVIYANTQYIAGKHLFKTIPEGISTTLTSLTDVPTCNVMTLVGANVGIGTTNPLNSLHVQNQSYFVGNVGLGTTNPLNSLHVQNQSYFVGNVGLGTTNPLNSLHVQNQSYFVGNVGLGTTNPLNSLHIQRQSYFVGNVGLGTTNPLNSLHVQNQSYFVGNVGIGITNPTQKLYVVGQIYATDNITAFSDSRYKTNVKKIENVMDKIKQINGYTFNRIDSDKSYMGVIAQEVQQVFPQIIESQGDTLSVAYGNLVAPLIVVVKELNDRIEVL
jgi:hypothetical protein